MRTEKEHCLYGCEQIRKIEQDAINILRISSFELMERAGEAAFTLLMKTWTAVRQVAVFCGAGSNAGDGYILARLLKEAGIIVTVYALKPPHELPEAANMAADLAYDAEVLIQDIEEPFDFGVDLIVDALLGTGITGAPREYMAAVIDQMNDSKVPILALDVPSGLQADTGKVYGACIKADHTITFIALKTGLYTLDGPDHCGKIHCASLDLFRLIHNIPPKAKLLQNDLLPLSPRKKNTHKGNFGHVLIIGGGPGMAGAVALAARSCLRTGAGLVTIATIPEHAATLTAYIPEAIVYGIDNPADLQSLLAKATVCISGPGLGDNAWAEMVYTTAVTWRLPMVLDASALYRLAAYRQQDDNWILTPHPGEAAALLGVSTETVSNDRYAAIASIQQQYGGVIVLKGCGTLIADLDGLISVSRSGNPGMATAGMGDVLTGIIAGLVAQGYTLSEAAKKGVFAHALAGDRLAARWGARGLLAGDLADCLPAILNGKV